MMFESRISRGRGFYAERIAGSLKSHEARVSFACRDHHGDNIAGAK
jgi:hypothetical protein